MSTRACERLGWVGRIRFVPFPLFVLVLLALPNGACLATSAKPEEGAKQASGKAGEVKTLTVNGVSFKMVRIPAGEFLMGSPPDESGRNNDETQHRVRISRDFWMGQTEVTQGLWKAVMGSNPSHFSNCGDDCPVEKVSWDDCQEFIRKLNGMVSGGNFRRAHLQKVGPK